MITNMEHISTPKVDNVKLIDRFNLKSSAVGSLYLTTTHLIFVSSSGNVFGSAHREQEEQAANPNPTSELWILHMLINNVEKPFLTTAGMQLRISCSNFR